MGPAAILGGQEDYKHVHFTARDEVSRPIDCGAGAIAHHQSDATELAGCAHSWHVTKLTWLDIAGKKLPH